MKVGERTHLGLNSKKRRRSRQSRAGANANAGISNAGRVLRGAGCGCRYGEKNCAQINQLGLLTKTFHRSTPRRVALSSYGGLITEKITKVWGRIPIRHQSRET